VYWIWTALALDCAGGLSPGGVGLGRNDGGEWLRLVQDLRAILPSVVELPSSEFRVHIVVRRLHGAGAGIKSHMGVGWGKGRALLVTETRSLLLVTRSSSEYDSRVRSFGRGCIARPSRSCASAIDSLAAGHSMSQRFDSSRGSIPQCPDGGLRSGGVGASPLR
jgi:hypothetical protein